MTRRRNIWRALWLSTVGLLLAGVLPACSPNEPPPPYEWPETFQFNFRWSSNSGVDLTSGPAIVTRAYLESGFLADAARPQDPEKYFYPGFSSTRLPNHYGERGLGGEARAGRTIRGTFYAHIVEVKPVRDLRTSVSTTADGWEMSVCTWLNGLTIDYGAAEYDSAEYNALYPVRLTYTITPTESRNPLPPATNGSGPSRFPTIDVFAGWRMFSVDGGGYESEKNPDQTCTTLPDNPVPLEVLALMRPQGATHFTSSEPLPTLDPYPGWPAP